MRSYLAISWWMLTLRGAEQTDGTSLAASDTQLLRGEDLLDKALADSFPASDPLSSLMADERPVQNKSDS
jgi:hypothetical protein